jgi:hypothetical protein
MMMPWASTAISVGSSLLGGAFGGGSKKAERSAKDAAARAQYAQELVRAQANSQLRPFIESGTEANNKLAYLLGTGGYEVAAPTYESEYEKLRDAHFKWAGKDYGRKSNVSGQRLQAEKNLQKSRAEWRIGFDEWKKKQGENSEFGSLNKNFTNDDFVKDPGYIARLLEGEQGIDRNRIARGGYDSGAALKELERFRQNYASNEFGNAYNRDASNKTRTYNQLLGASNQGLGAIGTTIGVSQNSANNSGNIGINQANQALQISQNNADNQSNAFQSAIGNLLYGINRNNSSGRTPDFNPYPSGGSSSESFARLFI